LELDFGKLGLCGVVDGVQGRFDKSEAKVKHGVWPSFFNEQI